MSLLLCQKVDNMKATRDTLKRIKIDALYGKKKHFNAADRLQKHHYFLGIPLVIVNIATGSILVYVLTENATNWIKYVPFILAFTASLLGGLQTFFNLPRKVEGHRRIENKYLSIMKRCDRLEAYLDDGIIDNSQLVSDLELIARDIESINMDAEAFPTNKKDYEKTRNGIGIGEESYTKEELEI